MVLDQVYAFFGAAKSVLDLYKGIRAELPESAKAKALSAEIDRAEQALNASEAELAKTLGYKLCRCTLPPQIMLWHEDRKQDVCPRCGHAYPPPEPLVECGEGTWTRSRR